MIVEVAIFEAEPGKEAALAAGIAEGSKVIMTGPGCQSVRVHRGIETPGRCILYVEWDSVQAHLDFRDSPKFAEWRSHINGLFGNREMEHYDVIATR